MKAGSTGMAPQLAGWLTGTGIEALELTGPGTTIRLRRQGPGYTDQAACLPGGTAAVAGPTVVRAGSVGVLLHTHPMRQAPLVQAGDQVCMGQALAVLRVGVLLLAVPSPREGVVARILVPDGAAVGYGEPLVELE